MAEATQYGIEDQVEKFVVAFKELETASPEECEDILTEDCSFSSVEIDNLLATTEHQKFSEIDFFEFARMSSIPTSLIEKAERQLELELAGDSNDKDKANDYKSFTLITHSFADVSLQTENGINAAKRMAQYLKKVCAAKESCAKKIMEVTAHEKGRTEDSMERCHRTFNSIQKSLMKEADEELKFAISVQTEIVDPLLLTVKELKRRRDLILLEERRMTAEMKAATESVSKSRNRTISLIEELKSTEDKKHDRAGSTKKKFSPPRLQLEGCSKNLLVQ